MNDAVEWRQIAPDDDVYRKIRLWREQHGVRTLVSAIHRPPHHFYTLPSVVGGRSTTFSFPYIIHSNFIFYNKDKKDILTINSE